MRLNRSESGTGEVALNLLRGESRGGVNADLPTIFENGPDGNYPGVRRVEDRARVVDEPWLEGAEETLSPSQGKGP
jgi:hypothetical protein